MKYLAVLQLRYLLYTQMHTYRHVQTCTKKTKKTQKLNSVADAGHAYTLLRAKKCIDTRIHVPYFLRISPQLDFMPPSKPRHTYKWIDSNKCHPGIVATWYSTSKVKISSWYDFKEIRYIQCICMSRVIN